MLGRLFLIFIGVPLLEMVLLIWIGQYFGVLNTLLLVIVTGAVGALMARYQGLKVLNELRLQFQRGQLPGNSLIEGGLVLAGGITFLTPGFITDTLGLLCLIPPTRAWMRERIKSWIRRKMERGEAVWVQNQGGVQGEWRFEKTIDYREPGEVDESDEVEELGESDGSKTDSSP